MTNKIKVIGVGGYARSGKDTFVKVASKILQQNGYKTTKLAFADGLKYDLDDWLKDKYGISAWTDNDEEKKLIRPFMVAHGCGKRIQTEGKYWVDKVNQKLTDAPSDPQQVYFVSDVRFGNEAKWLHENWNGYLVHIKRFSAAYIKDDKGNDVRILIKYDDAPNEEELKQDPLVLSQADYKLELENVIEREKRNGNIITADQLTDNSYLIEEITKCLTQCPFLSIAQK